MTDTAQEAKRLDVVLAQLGIVADIGAENDLVEILLRPASTERLAEILEWVHGARLEVMGTAAGIRTRYRFRGLRIADRALEPLVHWALTGSWPDVQS